MTTEPKMATTWEECARHVEAGGVVQGLVKGGVWRPVGNHLGVRLKVTN